MWRQGGKAKGNLSLCLLQSWSVDLIERKLKLIIPSPLHPHLHGFALVISGMRGILGRLCTHQCSWPSAPQPEGCGNALLAAGPEARDQKQGGRCQEVAMPTSLDP